jgi:hypothetical protein
MDVLENRHHFAYEDRARSLPVLLRAGLQAQSFSTLRTNKLFAIATPKGRNPRPTRLGALSAQIKAASGLPHEWWTPS